MVTGTAEYKKMIEERNSRRFGVETIHVTDMIHDSEEPLEFYGYNQLFGCRVPTTQRFTRLMITFTYEGEGYHFIADPIIKEVIEKDLFSSSKHAVLDGEAMEKQFKQELEELKETIKNDTETDKRNHRKQLG